MKRQTEQIKYVLGPTAVDECSEKANAFAESIGLPGKDCRRYVLSVDEILLRTSEAAEGLYQLRL